jgi:hypothetical protein
MRRIEKINEQGEIHPLQLQVDRIQFLVDKMFERQHITEGSNVLTAQFITEVSRLFAGSITTFLAFVPEQEQAKVLATILETVAQSIILRLLTQGGVQ